MRSPGQPSASHPAGNIAAVQILRFVAATLVVISHSQHEIGKLVLRGTPVAVPIHLTIGVDVFFVISGFIMVYTTSNKTIPGLAAAQRFFMRRVIRIVPLYWFYTSVMVAVSFLAADRMTNPTTDGWYILQSYLLIPAQHPVVHSYQPILRVGWTLIYEMFFYFVFAASLLMERRRGLAFVCVTIFTCVGLGVFAHSHSLAGFFTNSVMLSFVYGIVLAILFKKYGEAGLPASAILAVAAVVLYLILVPDARNLNAPRGIALGLPAALLVASGLSMRQSALKGPVSDVMVALGDSSYTIYLSHIFTIGAVKFVFGHLGIHDRAGVFACALIATGIAVACGYLLYQWIEVPLLSYMRRWLRASRFETAGRSPSPAIVEPVRPDAPL